jgi:hypothetical protein
LAVETGSPTLDERHVRCQTHLVDVPPRLQVVQRIEDYPEAAKPFDAELGVFDVGVMGDDLDCPVKLFGDFLGDLAMKC